jgi:hypothetical protein
LDTREAARDRVVGDLHQAVRDIVEDVDRLLALVSRVDHAHVADRHELAHQALVADDADVALDTQLARQALAQRREVGDATDRVQLLLFAQLLSDSDDVDGVARL